MLVAAFTLSACIKPAPPPPVPFPPPPPAPRLLYLGRLDEAPIDTPIRGAFRRWLIDERTFLETPFARPAGMEASNDRLYVCDAGAGVVVVLDYASQRTVQITGLARPVDVKLDARRRAYVADAEKGRVLVYDENHRLLRVLTEPAPGFKPVALAVDGHTLFVADLGDRTLWRHDLDTGAWRSLTSEEQGVGYPTGVCLCADRLWLVDGLDGRLLAASSTGGAWRAVSAPGELIRPRHMSADRDGRLLIADAAGGALQVRDPTGARLLDVRAPAILSMPIGVCVSTDLLRHYRGRLPAGFYAMAVVFVADAAPPAGVAVFAYAPVQQAGVPARP